MAAPITEASEAERPTGDEDVFISYSRKDQEIVRNLQSALIEQGRQVWVDWTGIAPADDWLATIKEGIDSAQAFVFVLSPNSLQSAVSMTEEVRHAQQARKRIIPVVVADFSEAEAVHEPHKEVSVELKNLIFRRNREDHRSARYLSCPRSPTRRNPHFITRTIRQVADLIPALIPVMFIGYEYPNCRTVFQANPAVAPT